MFGTMADPIARISEYLVVTEIHRRLVPSLVCWEMRDMRLFWSVFRDYVFDKGRGVVDDKSGRVVRFEHTFPDSPGPSDTSQTW